MRAFVASIGASCFSQTTLLAMQTARFLTAAFFAAALFLSGAAPAERDQAEVIAFRPDKTHSNVGFKVRHLGISNVRGAFGEYDAAVKFDPEDLSTLMIEATIQASSIDTGNERRDDHLRSDDFFNAEAFPELRFASKEVRNIDGGEFELVGDLTIRDVTKEVVLEAEFLGMGAGRNGRKAGFEARVTIDRFDYNLKFDALTETGGLVVGSDVEIVLDMELDERTEG